MADQLTESYSMPDVQLTEFPPSQRLGVSRPLKTPSLVLEVLTADQGSISESKSEPYSVSPMRPTSRPAVLEVVEM